MRFILHYQGPNYWTLLYISLYIVRIMVNIHCLWVFMGGIIRDVLNIHCYEGGFVRYVLNNILRVYISLLVSPVSW